MKVFVFFVLLTASLSAQTFQDVFNGKAVTGSTTTSATVYALVSSGVNTFDTLKILSTAGSNTSGDSANFAVYVQSYTMGSWSQGILMDSVKAFNTRRTQFSDSVLVGTKMLADTVKGRWFYGQSIPTEARNAIMSRNDWKFRFYIVGLIGNSINLSGGTAQITQIIW